MGVAAGCALARSMWSKASCLEERKKSFDLRRNTFEPALTDSTSSRCTLSENWSKGSPVLAASMAREDGEEERGTSSEKYPKRPPDSGRLTQLRQTPN